MEITGAEGGLIAAPWAAQHACWLRPTAPEVTLRWQVTSKATDYPQALFAQCNSRYTRAASDIATKMADVAGSAGGGSVGLRAIACHVAELFPYGHVGKRFNDGQDEIPKLCSRTVGSCVDINTYFIAAIRGAGYEAGYVTGYFIPLEKRTHCDDMHCWVMTRCDGVVQEWDIAIS